MRTVLEIYNRQSRCFTEKAEGYGDKFDRMVAAWGEFLGGPRKEGDEKDPDEGARIALYASGQIVRQTWLSLPDGILCSDELLGEKEDWED